MTLYILRTGGAVFQLSSPCNRQHTVPTGLFLVILLYNFIKIISTINLQKTFLIKITKYYYIFLTFLYTICSFILGNEFCCTFSTVFCTDNFPLDFLNKNHTHAELIKIYICHYFYHKLYKL